MLVEYGANGTATGTYEYGMQRLSVEYVNEAKEYYLYNGTGNVTQTTAQNGSMFLRYTYDPFGNVESIKAPMTVDIDDLNRYTYNGEDYDFNTGLQYLRARYYSTSTGSFISQDTYLGQIINPISRNRYTYAHNSPVVFIDPSGNTVFISVGGARDKRNEKNRNKDDRYDQQFLDAALTQALLSAKSEENVVISYSTAGWSVDDMNDIDRAIKIFNKANNTAITCKRFDSSKELVNSINEFAKEDEESIDKLYVFSHGLPYKITYGLHQKNDRQYVLDTNTIENLDSNAFSDDAEAWFFSCRTDYSTNGNESFACYFENKINMTTHATAIRTNYSLNRGGTKEYLTSVTAKKLDVKQQLDNINRKLKNTLLSEEDLQDLQEEKEWLKKWYNRLIEIENTMIGDNANKAEQYKVFRACYETTYKP